MKERLEKRHISEWSEEKSEFTAQRCANNPPKERRIP